MKNIDLQSINDRIAHLKSRKSKLETELQELTIAKRVFLKFPDRDDQAEAEQEDSPQAEQRPEPLGLPGELTKSGGAPRPDGIPSTFEMTVEVLKEAEQQDKFGMAIKEICDAIRDKYWPGLAAEQITPTIYQLAQRGRLKKENGIFRLAKF